MARLHSKEDECLILIKALPHRSSNYFETVCCAGIGRDRKWRRQYPVPFRLLDPTQTFGRWNWISYNYTEPSVDRRVESQKVVPESIQVTGEIKAKERSTFLTPIIRETVDEAISKNESLTLIRPKRISFKWERKNPEEVHREEKKHQDLANQLSLLDNSPATAFTPCPYEFRFEWETVKGTKHRHVCDDWETSTAFFRRRKTLGEEQALLSLRATYEDEYMSKGMAFGLGTHSRRKDQWLLVGVLRLDESFQGDFLL